MCNPQIIAGGAQAGTSVIGGMSQATQTMEQSRRNASLARAKAADALERGGLAEEKTLGEVRQAVGAQRAVMGASGLSVDSGSFQAVQDQSVGQGLTDAATIRSNALREAWSLKDEAAQMDAIADAAEKNHKVFDTLLTGGPLARKLEKKVGIFGHMDPLMGTTMNAQALTRGTYRAMGVR